MGWNPNAYAIVGVFLKKEECYGPVEKRKKERFKDREFPDNWKLDPETGKSIWYEHRPNLVTGTDNALVEDEFPYDIPFLPKGISCMADGHDGWLNLYLGYLISANEDSWKSMSWKPLSEDIITTVRSSLTGFLGSKGLWDVAKGRFGLHAVLS